jgi:tetratricopeptide (TPR) repeat protein
MPAPTLAEVRALRAAGQHTEHLAAARALALAEPTAVEAQIEAAYAHDRADLERDAIRYYDAAHALGIPAAERRVFLVGYGSTLRNVGRADDAVAILGQAIADDPDYPPFHAFLSLALFSAGHPRAALATMLGVALDASRPDAFDRYARALTEYQRELLADP